MKDKHKDIFILFLVFLYALSGVLFFSLARGNSAKAKTTISKVSPLSTQKEVNRFFKTRTTIKKSFSTYLWRSDGSDLYEEDIFVSVNATTAKQKKLARNILYKNGAKRYKRVCKQLDASRGDWSLGYCIDINIKKPIEG